MSARHRRRIVSGFAIHTLANDALCISVAPELGGRVVSLKDRISGREWLDGWEPAAERRIWQPTDPTDFASSPGAGIDECLPTVLPCKIRHKSFPDHGELWNRSPDFKVDPKRGISCHWKLKTLPLTLERCISVEENQINFHYRLENLADTVIPFLWAWHALFTWKQGDEICFAPSVTSCLTPEGDSLAWPRPQPGCDLSQAKFPADAVPAAKVFLGPLAKGHAEIRTKSGAMLTLHWPSNLFPYAGIWITCGFWKDLHHWAIEPTNAPVDRLSEIPDDPHSSLSRLAPSEVRQWTLKLALTNPCGLPEASV